jgi:hypothetical protein
LDLGVVVGVDLGVVVGVDLGMNVGMDVGMDLGVDVGMDVGVDVGVNVGMDSERVVEVGVSNDGLPVTNNSIFFLHFLELQTDAKYKKYRMTNAIKK